MRLRYKLLVLALIPALALVLSSLVPASGSVLPHPSRHCTSTYDFGLGLHNDENGGQADWETNTCSFTMQTRVQCGNAITGADYYVYSGEVHGLEIDDWAACDFGDYVNDFWIDPQDTNHWLDV